DILYGEGISKEGSLVDLGTELEIIQKSGAWYSYGGERLGQGRENVRDYLKEHKEIAREVEEKIRTSLKMVDGAARESSPAGDKE
ncbi:RecA, partial [mine drainage metagenome]